MVVIKFKPTLVYSNDNKSIRMLSKVRSDDSLKGRLIEVDNVKLLHSFLGFKILKIVGNEVYFNPIKKVVNTVTQRFVDITDPKDKFNPFINTWWELESTFTDFYAQQSKIRVLDHVTFKQPLFSILNNFCNQIKN